MAWQVKVSFLNNINRKAVRHTESEYSNEPGTGTYQGEYMEPEVFERFKNERHWQTQALVDVFAELPEGTVTTYQELSKLCEMSVSAVKKRMTNARNMVLEEHNVIIETERGKGVIRLPQTQIAHPVSKARLRMRNAAKKGAKLISFGITDFKALPTDTQTVVRMESAIFGTIKMMTNPKGRRLLQAAAAAANEDLKIGRTLDLLKSFNKK